MEIGLHGSGFRAWGFGKAPSKKRVAGKGWQSRVRTWKETTHDACITDSDHHLQTVLADAVLMKRLSLAQSSNVGKCYVYLQFKDERLGMLYVYLQF